MPERNPVCVISSKRRLLAEPTAEGLARSLLGATDGVWARAVREAITELPSNAETFKALVAMLPSRVAELLVDKQGRLPLDLDARLTDGCEFVKALIGKEAIIGTQEEFVQVNI